MTMFEKLKIFMLLYIPAHDPSGILLLIPLLFTLLIILLPLVISSAIISVKRKYELVDFFKLNIITIILTKLYSILLISSVIGTSVSNFLYQIIAEHLIVFTPFIIFFGIYFQANQKKIYAFTKSFLLKKLDEYSPATVIGLPFQMRKKNGKETEDVSELEWISAISSIDDARIGSGDVLLKDIKTNRTIKMKDSGLDAEIKLSDQNTNILCQDKWGRCFFWQNGKIYFKLISDWNDPDDPVKHIALRLSEILNLEIIDCKGNLLNN